MKFLSLTATFALIASNAFAGDVSLSTQDLGVSEAGAMGGSMQWLIPLAAIALIFLVSNANGGCGFDEKCEASR